MRTIPRRLRKLEDHFRLGREAEFDQRLRERIEAVRWCLADFEAQTGGGTETTERRREDISGLTIDQILILGWAKLAATIATDNRC
jgi:hypothetical protein